VFGEKRNSDPLNKGQCVGVMPAPAVDINS
jgi:hypothetical protein